MEHDSKEEFIRRYAMLNVTAEDEELDEDAHAVIKEHRKSVAFWWIIGILTLLPFLISGSLLYTLNEYSNILGNDAFEQFSESLNKEQIDKFGSANGLPALDFMLDLYQNRFTIISIIFGFFALVIAILIATRGISRHLRSQGSD